MSPNPQRSYSWRNRARDPALTTMLAVQCIIIFVSPFAAMGYEGIREALQLLFFAFTFLVCLLSRGLIAETFAILALICALTGFVLQMVAPSNASLILAFAGSISAFIVASYALGYATLAPGVVTVHRVLGAIALYLNLGLMFAAVYRLIWYFIPNSLTNIPGECRVAGLWHDTLFQLCDADIYRLRRCRAGSSPRPHADQCGGDHRPIVSGDPARPPNHPGTSKASAAILKLPSLWQFLTSPERSAAPQR